MTFGAPLPYPPCPAPPATPQPPPSFSTARTSSSLPLKPRQDSHPSPFSDILTQHPDRSSRAKRPTPSTWRRPPPPSSPHAPTRPRGAGSAGKWSPVPGPLPRYGIGKETTNLRSPRCRGAPANGEAAARAVAPPRRARGVMSLPSGGRGGALRAAAHCARPVPPPLPDTAGGPRSRSCAAWGGRPCTHPCRRLLAPRPAAPIPGVLPPAWLGTVAVGCAALHGRWGPNTHPRAGLPCAQPRCTHPGELPCAGRVASTHPSGGGLPCAHLRGQQLSRRAGTAAPSPAIPSVRRPGAAAPAHRR